MVHPYSLAAGAALLMSVSHLASAYSGDLGMGNPSLPVMMQFDDAPDHSLHTDLSATNDTRPHAPDTPLPAAAKVRRDEFQRYFDRHYRARLVLDSAAHRNIEVE